MDYIEELNKLRYTFKDYDISFVRQYIEENMEEEVSELKNQFEEDFKDIDDNNPLKIAVINTLQDFGILVNIRK